MQPLTFQAIISDSNKLETLLAQMVSLLKDDEPYKTPIQAERNE